MEINGSRTVSEKYNWFDQHKGAERPHLAKERHKNNDNNNNKNTIVVKLHVLCYNKRPILKSPQYFFLSFDNKYI